MSVSRLTSSSWRVPSGDRPPSAVPITVKATSPGVPADQHRHGVAHPRPHRPALGERVDQAGQVGVGEHQVRRAARGGRLGAARAPDAHADVGEPDRGGVVHPVAGHRQRRPGLAQRGDQRHLLLRGQPGEHRGLPHHAHPLRVRRPQELRPGHDAVRVRDPGLGGDRRRGLGVVAGRDQHPYPRGPQLRDREPRRLADAVGERDQPAQREVVGRLVQIERVEIVRAARDGPVRDRDHPQPPGGQPLHPFPGVGRRPRTGRARPRARPSR